MRSVLKEKCQMKIEPIGMVFSDEMPINPVQLKKGKWACAMNAVVSATEGITIAFDTDTCGCEGAGVGFGFGNKYENFPGGIECSYYFFSTGNSQWEHGKKQIAKYNVHGDDDFAKGVGFLKTPEHAKRYIENLPIRSNSFKYVIFKPLSKIEPTDNVQIITFFANLDQLSALVTMVNYDRVDGNGVIVPCCSACQAIGIYPIKELESDDPKAVVGMNDPTARLFLKRKLKGDYLTFSVPYEMFLNMEKNVDNSLLDKETWKKLCSI